MNNIFKKTLIIASIFATIFSINPSNIIASVTTNEVSETQADAVNTEASSEEKAVAHTEENSHADNAKILFVLAAILVLAKVLHLIEKAKQPPVVGELIAGIILGNLTLVGINYFDGVTHNSIIEFLAEMGVIVLLFQIGLETNVRELTKVGVKSLLVALVGALVPFVLGAYLVGPLLLPNQPLATYLFLGASLSATSVGITARIFKDMGYMQSKAARIVLGAAVIDDVIGLVMLAVISALVTTGSVDPMNVALIVFKSFAFLIGSVLLGQLIAPTLSKAFASINTGIGTKFTLAISFGLIFAGIAQVIGLEAIIGAFAAGLVLDHVHFERFSDPKIVSEIKEKMAHLDKDAKKEINEVLHHHKERNIEEIIEPLSLFFAPIFFVVTGMGVKIEALLSVQNILLALLITLAAVIGKLVSGAVIKENYKWVVGMAMVPRGEVGLIFAAVGQSLGVLSDQIFSVVVLTVLFTTVVGPFLLTNLIKRHGKLE